MLRATVAQRGALGYRSLERTGQARSRRFEQSGDIVMIPAAHALDKAAIDPSRSRARKAALGSFVGAVVDWYDFLLYGIVAALVFNSAFFPSVGPAMGKTPS